MSEVIKSIKKPFVTVGTSQADYIVDGVADDVQIQAAVTAVAGGTVFCKQGTYQITNPIVLPQGTVLIGEGKENTIFQLTPASLANFSFNYMINGRGGGSDCILQDIGFDGNYDNLSSPAASRGGLVEAQDGWIIERCEFKTSNYFKLFVNGVDDVIIRDCNWTGLTGAGNDCIGGGGVTNIIIENCRWADGVDGNNIDFTNGSGVTFVKNRVEGGCYFEGVTESFIGHNQFYDATLTIQSNAGYNPSTVNFPRNNTIIGNKFYETSTSIGIIVKYNDYASATTRNKGGGNIISGNTVDGTNKMGIFVFGQGTSFKDQADVIIGNKILNPNSDSTNTFNSGLGTYRNAGIVLGYGGGTNGGGDIISGNSISDNRGTALMEYGIAITGTSVGTVTIDSPLVSSNTIYRHTGADGIVIPNAGILTNQKIFNNLGSTMNVGSAYVALAGDTMTGDLIVPDEAYGSAWNGSLEVPTKNAVYDKIETIGSYNIKHQRVTTGSIAGGSTALVTLTWNVAFADANYTAQASVVDSTTTSLSLSVVHIESVSSTAVAVRILNNAIGALTGTLCVTAIHD